MVAVTPHLGRCSWVTVFHIPPSSAAREWSSQLPDYRLVWLVGEPDPDEWQFEARGLYTRGNDFLAFDGSLSRLVESNVAVDQAIARGLEWTRPASILNDNVGAATPDRLQHSERAAGRLLPDGG